MSIIELRQVLYRYPYCGGNAESRRRPALEGVSLQVRPAARLAILGANGAGKSTLLSLLNGSLRPQAGELLLDGHPLDYRRHSLDGLRQVVALMLQNPDDQLFAGSVRQDISFGPMNLGLAEAAVKERVEDALLALGLESLAELPPHQLSHGQRKRVALAGALAMQPRVLVLDEPTAGLDPRGVDLLTTQLDALSKRGIAIVLSTHDLDFAYNFAGDVALLHQGRVLAAGGRDLMSDATLMARSDLRVPTELRLRAALQQEFSDRHASAHQASCLSGVDP